MGKKDLERRIEELEAEVARLKRIDLNRGYAFPYWSVIPPTWPYPYVTCGTSTVADRPISYAGETASAAVTGFLETLSG